MNAFQIICLGMMLLIPPAFAEQPIFDEMPRWKGGYGVQFLQEYRRSDQRLDGRETVDTGSDERIHIFHIQGVYTWDKSVRMTLKVPVVIDARASIPSTTGVSLSQSHSGVGDPTLALPLKSYFNLDGRSGSWTLTPQIRFPGGEAGDYTVYPHHWGTGIFAGYETETHRVLVGLGASVWHFLGEHPANTEGEISFGFNFQVGPYSGHVKWKNHLIYEDQTIIYRGGPVLYGRLTDQVHAQLQWKRDFYTDRDEAGFAGTDSFRLGIAFVY